MHSSAAARERCTSQLKELEVSLHAHKFLGLSAEAEARCLPSHTSTFSRLIPRASLESSSTALIHGHRYGKILALIADSSALCLGNSIDSVVSGRISGLGSHAFSRLQGSNSGQCNP